MAGFQLNATPGDAQANAFAARAALVLYLKSRPGGDAVDTTDGAALDRALVTVTTRLAQERYAGTQASAAQALPWPRLGVPIPGAGLAGGVYEATTIPAPLVLATCEGAALLLLGLWDVLSAETALVPGAVLKVEGVELALTSDANALPPAVARALRGLREGDVGAGGSALTGGVGFYRRV